MFLFSTILLHGGCATVNAPVLICRGTPELQRRTATRRVWECLFLQRAMGPNVQGPTRQRTTYTLGPRITRTDTHYSRALDSPLDLANVHTTVFVRRKSVLYLTNGGCVRVKDNRKRAADDR